MNKKATILAVDDTSKSLALLVKILTREGYEVRPADSCELALASVNANPPDLILLDVRMKGMDGLEVCRRLKALEETQHIPIILISAFADVKDWVEGLRLGASDYITKPFQTEELLTRVKTYLTLRQATVSLEQQADALRQINEQLQSGITERKKTEEILREDEERLMILFGSAPDAYYMSDLKGNFVDGNKAAEELLGYNRDELIGKSFFKMKILSPKQIKKAAALLAKNLMKKATGPDEFVLNRKNGSQVTVEIRTHPFKIHNKAFVLGIAHDITKRKRAEEKLQASEEKFRNYIKRAPDGVFIVDETGRYIEVNESACRITGYLKEEIERMTIRDLLAEESLEDGMNHFQKLMETGAAVSDLWHKQKNGSKRLLTVNAVKLSKTRILGFCKDITKRKRAEQALGKAAEEREKLIKELQYALDHVKTLRGLIPICAHCKKVRDDEGFWKQVEGYISAHSDAEFTHGVCPDCAEKYYGEFYNRKIDDPNTIKLVTVRE